MKQSKLILFMYIYFLFLLVCMALFSYHHPEALTIIKQNPFLAVVILFFCVEPLIFCMLALLKISISDVLPKKTCDVKKQINGKALKKYRFAAKMETLFVSGINIECFNDFFIVTSWGCCEKFPYSSAQFEKGVLHENVLKVHTTTGKEIRIFANKNLYTFFTQHKNH